MSVAFADLSAAAAARQIRDDLVEGLLLGEGRRPGDLERWARHLGYDAAGEYRVLSVALDDAGTDAGLVAHAVDGHITCRCRDSITSVRGDEVVVIVRAPDATRLSQSCLRQARKLFPSLAVTVGIGGPCGNPAEIARSYDQARLAVAGAARLGRRGQAVAFEDLGILQLLLLVPDPDALSSFAGEVLGKLRQHDRERGTELLGTLACYFAENASPQRTARRLHLHPNTVCYRIKRAQEITGLRLDSYRDRLTAQVALEIMSVTG